MLVHIQEWGMPRLSKQEFLHTYYPSPGTGQLETLTRRTWTGSFREQQVPDLEPFVDICLVILTLPSSEPVHLSRADALRRSFARVYHLARFLCSKVLVKMLFLLERLCASRTRELLRCMASIKMFPDINPVRSLSP